MNINLNNEFFISFHLLQSKYNKYFIKTYVFHIYNINYFFFLCRNSIDIE